ncbi:MAG: right-handed parallel beta-helix repeat-containing protein [Tepidisphaeraceae bacterium]
MTFFEMGIPRTIPAGPVFALAIAFLCCNASFAQTTQPENTAARWVQMFDRDQNGFTNFPLGEDSRIILVSSTDGSDFYDGMVQPVRTLKKALSRARVGHPDRILFKRGDVFSEANLIDANIALQGHSAIEPVIIGAYGDVRLPRPVLESHLILGGRRLPRFIVLQGLDLYASSRDPAAKSFQVHKINPAQNHGVDMVSAGGYLWIEDCRCRDFEGGMVLQSKETDLFDTLIVRRCQVVDSWNLGFSSGIYIDNFKNVLIEENLFDHNGWAEGVPGAGKTIFNHNMYLQRVKVGEDRHFIVRNNISARASSHGCQMRPGGLLQNNLFLKNPLGAYVSYAPSVVRDNVVLDGDRIAPGLERGQGLEFLNCPTVLAEGNIVAHKPDPTNGMEAMSYDPSKHNSRGLPTAGEFRNNVVYDWAGVAFRLAAPSQQLSVHDNFFQQQDDRLIELKAWKPSYLFRNNQYISERHSPFQIAGWNLPWKEWLGQTGDPSDWGRTTFLDPSRDIDSYAKSIGLSDASLEGFLAAAREQRRGHWDQRLTAQAVNDYIRAGFARKSK